MCLRFTVFFLSLNKEIMFTAMMIMDLISKIIATALKSKLLPPLSGWDCGIYVYVNTCNLEISTECEGKKTL